MRTLLNRCWRLFSALFFALFLGLTWSAVCSAVELPVDAGSLLQQQQRSSTLPLAATQTVPVLRTVPEAGVPNDNGARVLVRRIQVEDTGLVFSADRLLGLLKSAEGQMLSLDELREVVQRSPRCTASRATFWPALCCRRRT